MAAKDRATLNSDADTNLPNNTTGDISPADVRGSVKDLADSALLPEDLTGATGKTTPVDDDTLPINDSAASNALKKVTWANVKATLKTYFDTLYQPLASALTNLASVWTPASASGPASQQFHEDTDNGSHKVTLSAPASLAADAAVVLPSSAGTLALTSDITGGDTVTLDVQEFTSSGTWNKPTGAVLVFGVIVGGGGGGGSGRKNAASGNRRGGAGGGGAARLPFCIAASALSSTEAVTIGAGGTGGAAQTSSDTTGNPGNPGGASSFDIFTVAGGALGGGGGSTSLTSTDSTSREYGSLAVDSATNAANAANPGDSYMQTAGGGGGSSDTSNNTRQPSRGGSPTGASHAAAGSTANPGTVGGNATINGGGGGGGGGGVGAANSAGAAGGTGLRGGGGGGGGCSSGTGNSGAGGDGGNGYCIVYTICVN